MTGADDAPTEAELAPENIATISPEMATEVLGRRQQRYTTANPVDKMSPDGIRAMSPKEATAALAEMALSRRPVDADGKPIPEPSNIGIVSSVELDARRAEQAKDHLEENYFPARDSPMGKELWDMLDGKMPVIRRASQ